MIVSDSVTGFMWQDDSRAKNVKRDWSGAKKYCKSLNFTGYDDWHVPSISELE
ncbi:MAG: DUF1566 domain-containing protein [Sulfurimonas sp.]|nr:DUF1566 domain-containing protein [Sulfurimonas sp.]